MAALEPPADDGEVGEDADEGERVTKPPPTVLTIVTPDTSVVVTTDPGAVATTVAVEPAPADAPAAVETAALD